MFLTQDAPDTTACDREPIHRLGTIQPFGFLIAVSRDWTIEHVSQNVAAHIGRSPGDLIGRPLSAVFDREAVHDLRNRLVQLYGSGTVERVFGLEVLPGMRFDCAVHEADALIVIEAEPHCPVSSSETAGLVRSMLDRLDAARDMSAFLRQGARQIHGLIGFDRVMVYRFRDDGSGEVVAEVARGGIEPLLGLRYPAADIPQQARALYLQTPFRIICDVEASPVAIMPGLDATGRPLDLSRSILRAVSPVHIAYLRNMGVAASLSVSIVVEGKLWGLFACHHGSARRPSFDSRTLAELFAQMFSMRLESRERIVAAGALARTRRIADRLMGDIARDVGRMNDADWLIATIGEIVPCDGVALLSKGRTIRSGRAPCEETVARLADRVRVLAPGSVFATDHLRGTPPAGALAADAPAGLLAIPISSDAVDYVMLFRRERIETVTWAGNPHKAGDTGAPGGTLSPRASFAAWREEVRHRSEPFTDAERAAAETLRVSLIEIVLRLAGSAIAERLRTNQRQEVIIAELNHRVRNILALIGGIVRMSGDPAMTVGSYVELLEGRILALARAHDQITRDNWGPAPIRQLFEAEGGSSIAAERIMLSGAPVLLDPLAYSTLSLVVHELMTNAAKHGALSGGGVVRVDWTRDPGGDVLLRWSEDGGPAVDAPRHQGLGTTIIRESIPHELGGTARIDFPATGLDAHFVIPARHASDAAMPERIVSAPASPADDPDRRALVPSIEGTVLLVEDSLLIAIHVENILAQMGMVHVVTASTAAAALSEIARARPRLAVLDFNLGDGDSLGVADRLLAEGVPYVFATGYGDQLRLPARHAAVPILQKPYNRANLAAALAGMIRGPQTGDPAAIA